MKKAENLQVCSSRTTEIAETINRKVSYCINQIESEIPVGNNISSLSGRNSVNVLLLGDYQDELKITLEKTTSLPVTLLKFSKGMGHDKKKLNSTEQLNLFRTEFLEAIKRKGIVLLHRPWHDWVSIRMWLSCPSAWYVPRPVNRSPQESSLYIGCNIQLWWFSTYAYSTSTL